MRVWQQPWVLVLMQWVGLRGQPWPCPGRFWDVGGQRRDWTRQLVHVAWGPLTPLGVLKAGREPVNWCQQSSKQLPDTVSVLEEAAQARGNVKCLSLLWADITSVREQSMGSRCGAGSDLCPGLVLEEGPEGRILRCPYRKARSQAQRIASLWASSERRQETRPLPTSGSLEAESSTHHK